MRLNKGGPPKSPKRLAVIAAVAALEGKEATYQDIADTTGLDSALVGKIVGRERLTGAKIHVENRRRKGRVRPVINPTDAPTDGFQAHLSNRVKVPLEVVPKVDQLKAAGYTMQRIAYAMQCSKNSIYNVLHREGAYAQIPRSK